MKIKVACIVFSCMIFGLLFYNQSQKYKDLRSSTHNLLETLCSSKSAYVLVYYADWNLESPIAWDETLVKQIRPIKISYADNPTEYSEICSSVKATTIMRPILMRRYDLRWGCVFFNDGELMLDIYGNGHGGGTINKIPVSYTFLFFSKLDRVLRNNLVVAESQKHS